MEVITKRLPLSFIAGRQRVGFTMVANRKIRREVPMAHFVTLLLFGANFLSIVAQETVSNDPAGSQEPTTAPAWTTLTSGQNGVPPQTSTEFRATETGLVRTSSSSMSTAAGTASQTRVDTTRRQTSQQPPTSTAGPEEQTIAAAIPATTASDEKTTVTIATPVSTESDKMAVVTNGTGIDGVTQEKSTMVTSSSEPPMESATTTSMPGVARGPGTSIRPTEEDRETTVAMTTTTDDACSSAPCQNGGACTVRAHPTRYNCACAQGWMGTNCTQDIDECATGPCRNGGTCQDGVGNFTCLCPNYYSGATCAIAVRRCSPNPCLNDGVCTETPDGFSCGCPPGFNGTTCEHNIDECMSYPCQNGAACVDEVAGVRCNCSSLWTGVYCTEDVDECRDEFLSPCHHMAECVNTVGNYTCTCKPGYTGSGLHCEFIDMCLTQPPPCGNGHCFSKMYGYECKCKTGWTGGNCTEDIDECMDGGAARCDSGGATRKLCVNLPGDFSCECPPGTHPNRQADCVGDVLYRHGNGTGYQGDDELYGPFHVPGGFPFYGQQYYSIYASMNGYVIFEKKKLTPHPPGGAEARFPESTAIIAPLWADIDTSTGTGAMYVDIHTPMSPNSSRFEAVKTDIAGYVGRQDLSITVAMVITWKDVALFPAFIYSGVKSGDGRARNNATFQLVLATSNEESFAMFNYNPDGYWWDFVDGVDVRKVLIGLTDGGSNSIRLTDVKHYPANVSNVDLFGRYFYTLGTPVENPKVGCLSWSSGQDVEAVMGAWQDSVPCPCTWAQAMQDTRFTLTTATWCVETRLTTTATSQKCCYDNMLALVTGYPGGGHLVLQGDTEEVKDICCNEEVGLCDLYYKVRPSDNCSRYAAPAWGSMWGVGHVETLNGTTFTVNALTELMLLYQPDRQFMVQGRMGLVSTLDGSTKNATGLVAIAAKSNYSVSTELRLTEDRSDIRIHVDGVDTGTMATMTVGDARMYAGVFIERLDNDTVLLQFVDGVGLKVSRGYGFLELLVTMATPLATDRERVGLFTHVTGKEGEVVMATAHRLQQDMSLFTYSVDGKTFKDFQMRDYVPENFVDVTQALIGQPDNQSEAVRSCDGIMECLYDYVASGNDIEKGIAAITADVRVKTNRRKLENFPPQFTEAVPRVLSVTVDRETRVTLTAVDPEGGEVVYNVSTNIPASHYRLDNGVFTWTPQLSYVQGNASFFIKFTATDLQGATAALRPETRMCTCGRSDECYFGYLDVDGADANPDRYYESMCQCRAGYTGRLCLDWDALCRQNPCYANDVSRGNCTFTPDTSPWGFSCTPCPEGLTGDGIKCYDDNECVTGANECSHICYNQPGGYTCGCQRGYQLSPDGATCRDIDECTVGQHQCDQVGQYCQNTPGFYSCACTARYLLDDSQCRQAGKRFGGTLRFTVVKLDDDVYQGWDASLKDPESELYNQMATRVESQVDVIYQGTPGFLSSSVTKFSEGSIAADFDLFFNVSSAVDGATVADVFSRYLSSSQCQANGPDCSLADLVGVSLEGSSTYAKDLCVDEMDNDCHSVSTNCSSFVNGTFDCQCKVGYAAWLNSRTICQDIDECSYGHHTCDVTISQCVNTPGSYDCQCLAGYRKVGNTCTAVCRPNPCLNGGKCLPASDTDTGYTCRCRNMWVGTNCDARNGAATRLRNILIGVGVGLGVLCLILFLLLIVACIRMCKSPADDLRRNDKTDDSFDVESKISHSVWVDRLFSSALSLHDDECDPIDDRTISRMNTFGKKKHVTAHRESKS